MRLINAASLELERFDDDNEIPPYAVLSHTWGSGEVSLQQFEHAYTGDESTRNRIKSMLGYGKIAKTCEQALKNGYAYAWVDTCCIDKTSSAELSEAINSMFRWYMKAEVCYALLEDVSTCVQNFEEIGEQFEKARWFTRGWTLQELIAPREVWFFAAEWIFVGARADMHECITQITGIDSDVLLESSRALGRKSVAKRMSWAAKRTTARVEDTAYCLMSLFDVNMPLIYGEGKRAFVRLQEEILKESDDQSLFAWDPPDDRYYGKGMSVFAEHPIAFARSGNMLPLEPQGDPPAVTNRGVKIDLPVLKLDQPLMWLNMMTTSEKWFLVVFYCGQVEFSGEIIQHAILVRRLQPGKDFHEYVRHGTARTIPMRHDEILSSDLRQIYLRKRIRVMNLQHKHKTQITHNTSEHSRFKEVRSFQPKDSIQCVKERYVQE